MKVFCSGFELNFIHNKIITGKFDEYILSNDEIVVSDMNIMDEVLQQYLVDANYENVTIAFIRDLSEYEEWPRTNLGNWKYREFIRRQHEYSIDLTIASAMAEECDEGFFTFFGMYADIDDALYYLQSSIYDSNGGKLEVWVKTNGIPKYSHYEHRITLYTNSREVIGFEFMRTADLINDCDPFEPVTYVSKNSHYMSR